MAGDRKRATLGDAGRARQRGGLGRGVWALLLVFSFCASGAWADNANGEPIGSGDGRIHVIPTLSRPSVKNGEKLSIQAIVKAPAGVASVEALIARESPPTNVDWSIAGLNALNGLPVARLELRPAPGNLGGVNGTDTMGLWQADWTAHNLDEAWYRVTLTITDQTGHQYQDTALRFSDPIAGIDTIGTTEYPDGGMRRMDALELPLAEDWLTCAVIDSENGYAYFGTNTSPALVVKVQLGKDDAPPTRVGTLTLNDGESSARVAVIDSKKGHAYFAINLRSVVKIALGAGNNPPTRVGTMTVDGEYSFTSAVIDAENGYAYFGTWDSPGRVVKIALGEGNASPSHVGTLELNEGENRLTSAAIDLDNGYAYFGTDTRPGRVIKIALGEGTALPTRAGAVELNDGENRLACAVIDQENSFVYFGTNTYHGRVVKVALGTGSEPPVRVGALTITINDSHFHSAVIDTEIGYAYFGTSSIISAAPGHVVKVALGTGNSLPTSGGSVTINENGSRLTCAVIDPKIGYAWFGTRTNPSYVVKLALGEGDAPPTHLNTLNLSVDLSNVSTLVIDPEDRTALAGVEQSNYGHVMKMRLGDLNMPPTQVGTLELEDEEKALTSAVIDVKNDYAYLGTATFPGRVVKVALGEGDTIPTRIGAVTLNHGEDGLFSAVIDAENGYAYFGTATLFPSRVVKVALGEGDLPPTRVGAVTLDFWEGILTSAVIDTENGYAYFGTDTVPGRVVKLALGEGNDPPSRVGAVILNTGEDSLRSAVIDPKKGYAYFGGGNILVKIALGEGNEAPTRIGAVRVNSGYLRSAMIDPRSGYAYFGTTTSPGRIEKIMLGADSESPIRVGTLTLEPHESRLWSGAMDPISGYAYFGTKTVPSSVVRIALSQQGFVKATRLTLPEEGAVDALRFYSHQAEGNLRLALYDAASDPALLWQSGVVPNTAEEDWLNVPVSSGTPSSLALPAGDYWLAWQVDTMAHVASFMPGTENSGLQVPLAFGNFPSALEIGTDTQPTYTNENWSAYVVYGPPDNTPPNALNITPAATGPTNASSVSFIVDFDEPVQNFDDASDLFVDHTGTASTSASITGGPESYTVTVGGISGDGSFTLSVNTTSDVADLAGNPLASSVTSVPVVIDNTPPALTAFSVLPSALAPGDGALIQFEVSEMLLGDPVVEVAGVPAVAAPLEAVKSLGHAYQWIAPMGAPVGRISGRPLVPGIGYVNPDPWPYGPRDIEITLTDLAGNTITHTEPEGLALVSGLPLAWPGLAFLAMIFAAAFALRKPGKARISS